MAARTACVPPWGNPARVGYDAARLDTVGVVSIPEVSLAISVFILPTLLCIRRHSTSCGWDAQSGRTTQPSLVRLRANHSRTILPPPARPPPGTNAKSHRTSRPTRLHVACGVRANRRTTPATRPAEGGLALADALPPPPRLHPVSTPHSPSRRRTLRIISLRPRKVEVVTGAQRIATRRSAPADGSDPPPAVGRSKLEPSGIQHRSTDALDVVEVALSPTTRLHRAPDQIDPAAPRLGEHRLHQRRDLVRGRCGRRRGYSLVASEAATRQHSGQHNPYRNASPHTTMTLHRLDRQLEMRGRVAAHRDAARGCWRIRPHRDPVATRR